jgi:hypothetical protein
VNAVVPVHRKASLPALDHRQRNLLAWALSQAEEPLVQMPDEVDEVEPLLPALIERERASFVPAGAAEVLRCLAAFAERRGLPMPEDDLALDLDVELMGEWPRDLFRAAIRAAWLHWPYRRLPDANALLCYIRQDLEERTGRLKKLELLAKKLEFRRRLADRTTEMRRHARR